MRKILVLVTAFMMMAYPLGAMGTSAEGDEKMLNEPKKISKVEYLAGVGVGLGAGLLFAGGLSEAMQVGIGITVMGTSLCVQAFNGLRP